MGLLDAFRSRPAEPQNDQEWLVAGHRRFDTGKARHFGSPETMRTGGGRAQGKDDFAAAVFYFAKAIDIAHTWTVNPPRPRSFHQDVELFDLYASAVAFVAGSRPGADQLRDWNNENATTTINRMIAVAQDHHAKGRPTQELDRLINSVIGSTGGSV